MPKKLGWQRILIGLLLLLNALPFSGGREMRLELGTLFIVAGWGLLSWPILVNIFLGPDDDSGRKFCLLDAIKIATSACLLFWSLFSRNEASGSLPVVFFAIGVILLFVPIEPLLAARHSTPPKELQDLDNLKASGVIGEDEYIRLKNKILNDIKP